MIELFDILIFLALFGAPLLILIGRWWCDRE